MTQKRVTRNINVENARIGFRNFSGKEGQFNPAGNRNFVIFLDDNDFARELEEEGWNIRWLDPREEDEESTPILSVRVAFGNFPPKIVLVTDGGQNLTQIGEDQVSLLDWADVENIDLTVNPYNYNVRGKTGVKAYLKSMYVTIREDEWESKYKNPPDSAKAAVCDPGFEFRDGECRRIE